MTQMSYKEQSLRLAGPIALLKLLATRVSHNVSDESCQIFGGRSITKTGMGRVIEGFQRTYKVGDSLVYHVYVGMGMETFTGGW